MGSVVAETFSMFQGTNASTSISTYVTVRLFSHPKAGQGNAKSIKFNRAILLGCTLSLYYSDPFLRL